MSTTAELTMVCAIAHAGPHGDAAKGRKYRDDDPRVLAAPQFFVDADTPEEEWPGVLDRAFEQAKATEAALEEERRRERRAIAEQNRVKLKPELLKVVESFVAHYDGQLALIEKGSIVTAEDSLAVNNPERFKPV